MSPHRPVLQGQEIGKRAQDQPEEAASEDRLQRKIVSKLVVTHRVNLRGLQGLPRESTS